MPRVDYASLFVQIAVQCSESGLVVCYAIRNLITICDRA